MPKTIDEAFELTSKVKEEVAKLVFGMDDVMDAVLIALFAGGHIILEGVPGTAKTRLLKSVAETLSVPFERVQMTMDLLPSDIIGQEVYNPSTKSLEFRKGPIFTWLFLADELNRASPKAKSAVLEAMAEKQVTVTVESGSDSSEKEERTIKLPEGFTFLATQNPKSHEGTYPLDPAERDRFLMKYYVGYVSKKDELAIAVLPSHDEPLEQVMSGEDVLSVRSLIWNEVHIDDDLLEKIVDVVMLTRPEISETAEKHKVLSGASSRASQALVRCSKVRAFLNGRDYVTPEDIMDLTFSVFWHRVDFKHPRKQEWRGLLEALLLDIHKEVFGA